MTDLGIHILSKLLEHRGDFVSGNVIAQTLGVSRVSVWKHVERLHALAIGIEAIRNRGYRLTQEPPFLCEPLLKAYCNNAMLGCPVYFYKSIDSTNSEAQRLLASQSPTPFAVVAQSQTAGRGRLGRQWASTDTGNLYLSLGFKPLKRPEEMQCFTLWIGVALAMGLRERYGLPVWVKWPNDLMIDSKKCCGILTEAVVDADYIKEIVLGVGLNVNGTSDQMPESLRHFTTSLFSASYQQFAIHSIASNVIQLLLSAYESYISGAYRSLFKEFWPKLDYLKKKSVRIQTPQGGIIEGICGGIDNSGALVVSQSNGETHIFHAGQVTLLKQ